MSDPVKELQDSFSRATTLAVTPFDAELYKQAEATLGDVGSKALMDEYSRLVLQKYHRPARRAWWSRLFGR